MPNSELINEYIDLAAITKQTDSFISEINRVKAAYQDLANAKNAVSGAKGLPNISAGIKESQSATEALATSQQKLNVIQKESVAITTQQVTAQKQLTVATQEQIRSLEQNIQARVRLQNSMASYLASQKEDLALMKAGTITRAEYNKRFTESQIKIEQYKNKITDLDREIKKQTASTQALTKEMKLQQAVNDAERNSLGRAQALILLYTNEKKKLNLATEEGRRLNDNYNKAIAKSNEFILKNADAETARTKNIGNYGSALNKILGPVRTLANILPGLGMSGIFLLAFEAITFAANALGLFNSKLTETARQRELLNKLNEDADKSAGKEAASLKILRAEIESTTVPMKTRLQAVKDLKEEYPDYFQGLTNEQILTGKVGDAYDKAADAILRKAKAQAAASQLEALAAKEIESRRQTQQDIEKTAGAVGRASNDVTITSGGSAVGAGGNFGGLTKAQNQANLKEAFADREKARQQERAELKRDQDFLLQFVVAGAKETVKIDKDKNEKVRESTKATLDSDFELYRIAQNRKIKILAEETDDQKLSFEKRISLLQDYSTARLELIDREKIEELRKLNEKEAALQANLKKAKGTERNNILIEIANVETAKKVAQAKADDERLAVFRDNEKKFNVITKEEADAFLKIQREKYEKALQLIDENRDKQKALLDKGQAEALDGLQKRLEEGTITQKEFNKKRLGLEYDYQVESIKIEIDRIKKIIFARAILGQDVSKEQAALAKLERELAAASLAFTKKTEEEKQKAIIATLEKIKSTANDVFGLIGSLLNANLTSTKNQIKEEQDAAEKKAQRDIELVNASTLSEQEKADKILIINARLAAQKEQFARREKQAEIDKAKFDKAAAMANILINTALAVVKALPNIPLAVAIGALGAAQFAIAASTPIPKFRTGKGAGNYYEGLAVVGDGGKSEVIAREDGTLEFTPATDTLTHVKKNDVIYPSVDAWREAVLNAAFRDANRGMVMPGKSQGNPVLEMMRDQKKILKQIADKPVQNLAANRQGLVSVIHWGANQTKWINEQTQF